MTFAALECQARAALRRELDRPPQPALDPLLRTISDRYGEGLVAILYYGSCRREDTLEGLVDFHVIVKDYSALSWGLGLAASLLPPNVYYLEVPSESGTLRCKYALLTQRQFLRGCSRLSLFPYFWARYAQPMSLLACEHRATRTLLASAMLGAAETLLVRTLPGLPEGVSGRSLWQAALGHTYGTELRPEGPGRGEVIIERDLAYFEALSAPVLARESAWRARRGQRLAQGAWTLRRLLGKPLALARLFKALLTFEGALDYGAWKLERHSGERLTLTPRLRRFPWLFVWPELWRLWRAGRL
jgi:hypothetical protein